MSPDLIERCDVDQVPGKIIAWARRAITMSFDGMTAWAQTFI
jgi:hypothetical protein